MSYLVIYRKFMLSLFIWRFKWWWVAERGETVFLYEGVFDNNDGAGRRGSWEFYRRHFNVRFFMEFEKIKLADQFKNSEKELSLLAAIQATPILYGELVDYLVPEVFTYQ